MVKKLVSLLALILIVTAIASVSVAESIQPYAAVECRAIAVISISGGKAQAIGNAASIPDGYTVSTSVILQKKSGGSWIKVTSSSGSNEACASSTATKGVTYRAYATCKLYNSEGDFVDSISATSASKTY